MPECPRHCETKQKKVPNQSHLYQDYGMFQHPYLIPSPLWFPLITSQPSLVILKKWWILDSWKTQMKILTSGLIKCSMAFVVSMQSRMEFCHLLSGRDQWDYQGCVIPLNISLIMGLLPMRFWRCASIT